MYKDSKLTIKMYDFYAQIHTEYDSETYSDIFFEGEVMSEDIDLETARLQYKKDAIGYAYPSKDDGPAYYECIYNV